MGVIRVRPCQFFQVGAFGYMAAYGLWSMLRDRTFPSVIAPLDSVFLGGKLLKTERGNGHHFVPGYVNVPVLFQTMQNRPDRCCMVRGETCRECVISSGALLFEMRKYLLLQTMFLFLCLRVSWSEADVHDRSLATQHTLRNQTLVRREKAVNQTSVYETERQAVSVCMSWSTTGWKETCR